eukprot:scaffold17506_cov132-Isochrysis_galbana.AAC.7
MPGGNASSDLTMTSRRGLQPDRDEPYVRTTRPAARPGGFDVPLHCLPASMWAAAGNAAPAQARR